VLLISRILITGCAREAESESQRMAAALLHLVPVARRVLRAQHVRRRRRRELPQMSREPGAGREGSSRRNARSQDRPQAKTFVTSRYVTLWLPSCLYTLVLIVLVITVVMN